MAVFFVCQGEGKPCTVNRHGQRPHLAKDQSHRWVDPLVGGSPHELCYFGLDMYCVCGYILHQIGCWVQNPCAKETRVRESRKLRNGYEYRFDDFSNPISLHLAACQKLDCRWI
jgi:hypothetical protein